MVEKSQKKNNIKDFAKWENIGQFLHFSTILATKKLHYTAVSIHLYKHCTTAQCTAVFPPTLWLVGE